MRISSTKKGRRKEGEIRDHRKKGTEGYSSKDDPYGENAERRLFSKCLGAKPGGHGCGEPRAG